VRTRHAAIIHSTKTKTTLFAKSTRTSNQNSTPKNSTSIVATEKRNISLITELARVPPPVNLDSVIEGASLMNYGELEVTTQPQMANQRAKPCRSQRALNLNDQFITAPDPAPSASWQGRSSVPLNDLIKATQPIDPSTAVRHSVYDSRKTARDVLRATGRHPHEARLNAHLAGPESRVKKVDDSSDLSIFGSSPACPDPAVRNSGSANMTTVDRSTNASERPHTQSPLKYTKGEIPSSPHGISRQPNSIPSWPIFNYNGNTPGSGTRSLAVVISSPPARQISNSLVFGLTKNEEDPVSTGSSKSTPRRGRPQRTPASKAPNGPALTPKENGSAFKNSKITPATEPVKKKRGRPFSTPAAAAAAAAKKRIQQLKPKLSGLDIPTPPDPQFIPFLCEWEGCPAELHNLETLRAHIFTTHNIKRASGTRPCLWTSCSPTREVFNNPKQAPRVSDRGFQFKTEDEWQDHINKAHLIPLAWHMGDGPKGTSLGRLLQILLLS
jgi:hypothetical protein